MNRALRDHLTRGFSLSLTHAQLRALVAIDRRDEYAVGDLRALTDRGLIALNKSEPVLTDAGEYVLALLSEADLMDGYVTTQGETST